MKQKHGIDCSCKECGKVRNFLKKKEKEGKIYLGGLEEDKEKIRRWNLWILDLEEMGYQI